jgi:hypothetical protein
MIKSMRMKWAGHVAQTDEMRNAYKLLVGKPEGMRPFGRLTRTWEDNFGKIKWKGVHRTHLDLVVGSCEHGNEHYDSINGEEFDYMNKY